MRKRGALRGHLGEVRVQTGEGKRIAGGEELHPFSICRPCPLDLSVTIELVCRLGTGVSIFLQATIQGAESGLRSRAD